MDSMEDDNNFLTDALANLQVEIINHRVYCPRDMFHWERSEAMADIVAFVERMNVMAKRYRSQAEQVYCPEEKQDVPSQPGSTDRVLEVLRNVGDWAKKHKPACRAGFSVRPSFLKFYDLLHVAGHDLLIQMYGRQNDHRTVELPVYLENSFGDPNTMTYGLEHELSFCMFLIALFKLHYLTCADEPYIVTVLFNRYLDVAEYLIEHYRLEPSTKYGSFGLNDHWYVAFLWGSAQLAGNEEQHGLSPASAIGDVAAARRHGAEYAFLKCMGAVHRRAAAECCGDDDDVDDDDEDGDDEDGHDEDGHDEDGHDDKRRQRPLWMHSYQLWNLTALPRWDRVNDCLMAAFRCQVLDRFGVVRRLMFGELLRFTANPRPPGVSFYDCIPPAASVPYAKRCGTDAQADAEEGAGAAVAADDDDDEELTMTVGATKSHAAGDGDVQAEEFE